MKYYLRFIFNCLFPEYLDMLKIQKLENEANKAYIQTLEDHIDYLKSLRK